MTLAEWMTTDPLSLPHDAPVATARALMGERRIRHLPVTRDGRVVGLLSDLDLPSGEAPVGEVAVPPTLARLDDAVGEVLARLSRAQRGCVVVVDEAGALLGVLTEVDVVARAAEELPVHRVVEDVASTTLHTCAPGDSVGRARTVMRHAWVRHLVVCDQGRLAGVLSERDLAGADPDATLGSLLEGSLQFTVGWRTPLAEAAAQMARQGIGCLPVVDDEAPFRVQAVVTRTDLVRAMGSALGPGVAGS